MIWHAKWCYIIWHHTSALDTTIYHARLLYNYHIVHLVILYLWFFLNEEIFSMFEVSSTIKPTNDSALQLLTSPSWPTVNGGIRNYPLFWMLCLHQDMIAVSYREMKIDCQVKLLTDHSSNDIEIQVCIKEY